MGLLTTSGSLARVVGPVFVSYIYQELGTWVLFGIVASSLGISFIVTTLAYRQLVPHDQIVQGSIFEQLKFWKGWTGFRKPPADDDIIQKPKADDVKNPE